MRLTNAPFWGGFPWEQLALSRDYFLVVVNSVPSGWGFQLSDQGQGIYVPPVGRVQYRFVSGGADAYSPWLPINQDRMLFPSPTVDPVVAVELMLHQETGVSISVFPVSLS